MYEVRVQTHFYAAHRVRIPGRPLEAVHDHDFMVEAVFRDADVDDAGILVDFAAVKRALHRIVEPLSDTNLGSSPLLAGLNPSAEHLARRLFDALLLELGADAPLAAVYVTEAPGCVAGYVRSTDS